MRPWKWGWLMPFYNAPIEPDYSREFTLRLIDTEEFHTAHDEFWNCLRLGHLKVDDSSLYKMLQLAYTAGFDEGICK